MDELYKMILVDDEDEVRGRISSKISEESGFEVVGTAGNGYDALELIEKYSPHIVLTDIKMPFIDGIELARIVKRDFPTTRVAFITGYDEFDYAREAVELHISSYLTKPVTQNDISKFLTRLKNELDDEFKKQYNLEILKRRYEESLPLIIDNYFVSFLISSSQSSSVDIENLRKYGVSLDDTGFLLSFMRIERDDSVKDIIEYEKLKLSVRSVVNTLLDRHGYEYHCFLFNGGIVFIVKEKGSWFLKKIDPVYSEMVQMVDKFLSARIDIGISSLHKNFNSLKDAYQEAEKALDYSTFLNAGRIVYIDQLENKNTRTLSLSDSETKDVEYRVRFGSEEELRTLLLHLKRNALKDNLTPTNYKIYVINLVNIVVRFAHSIDVDLYDLTKTDIFDKMMTFRDLDQLFDWVTDLLLQLRKHSLTVKMTNSQRFLDSAVSYIDANYQDPEITMESVCDYLGISISYLSLLFKKYNSTTFVKYLTSVRMEKAKEYLKLTGDRIIEVAGKCGYKDVYYFSHSFKKYSGVSPKKYREETN